jgi:predicted transcriptional regulator
METVLKTVKIPEDQYKAMKTLAKKRGRFLQFLLTEAIRQYLATEHSKERLA